MDLAHRHLLHKQGWPSIVTAAEGPGGESQTRPPHSLCALMQTWTNGLPCPRAQDGHACRVVLVNLDAACQLSLVAFSGTRCCGGKDAAVTSPDVWEKTVHRINRTRPPNQSNPST